MLFAVLTGLWWPGTEPAVPLRYFCTGFTECHFYEIKLTMQLVLVSCYNCATSPRACRMCRLLRVYKASQKRAPRKGPQERPPGKGPSLPPHLLFLEFNRADTAEDHSLVTLTTEIHCLMDGGWKSRIKVSARVRVSPEAGGCLFPVSPRGLRAVCVHLSERNRAPSNSLLSPSSPL